MRARDELLAWAAGFVDGDGSVCISFSRHQRQLMLTLQVGQNVDTPLLRLRELFGGSVKQYGGKRKTLQFTWRIHSANAVEALRAMRPWLAVKDQHADLAIEFWDNCGRRPGWNAGGRGRARSLSDDEQLIRLEYRVRMQSRQHKGIHRRGHVTVADLSRATKEVAA